MMIKRLVACVLAATLMLTMTACGDKAAKDDEKNSDKTQATFTSDSAIAMIVDGREISKKVFAAMMYDTTMYAYYESGLYQYEAYYGVDVWQEQYTYKKTGEKLLLADYIRQTTKDAVTRQVAVQQLMKEYGVTVPEEELTSLREDVSKISAEKLTAYGFDADSYVAATASSLEETSLFYDVYGIGGEKGVTEDEAKEYYDKNFVSYYIAEYATDTVTADQRNALNEAMKTYNTLGSFQGALSGVSIASANTVENDPKLVEAVLSVAVGEAKIVEYTNSKGTANIAVIVRAEAMSFAEQKDTCAYGMRYDAYDDEVEAIVKTMDVTYNEEWIAAFDPTVFIESEDEEDDPVMDSVGTVTSVTATHYAVIDIQNYGTIKVALDANTAPITVANFKKLADAGFYNGLTFHRIIENFMMQGGDPNGNGTGGSDEQIKGEFAQNGVENPLSHVRGAISMARSSAMNSASSQFFIVHKDSKYLDGQYAVFGYVVEGMDVVDAVCTTAEPTDSNGTIPADEQPVITSITVTAA